MKLKKLCLNNIRSYRKQEVKFPEGSILLSGDIGSGKTTILLAIEYALFGLQPGQRGSMLLSNGKNTGSVRLELEIDGKNVIIERSLKRSAKTISQDQTSISIDGEKTESSITEIKTKIIELLNYPLEFIKKNNLLFRYTVYTPQEEMKQIILEDPESRLNILRHIFGMDKYKRIKENLFLLASKLREETRILQVEIKDLEEDKEKIEENKEFVFMTSGKIEGKNKELVNAVELRKNKEKEAENLREKVKEKENFSKEIEKTKILLSSKREQLMREKKDLKDFSDKLAEFREEFDEIALEKIKKEIESKLFRIENLNKETIENSAKVNSLELINKEDFEKKKRIFEIDFCPTCLQDVSEVHKHNILNSTEAQIKKNEVLANEIDRGLNQIKLKTEEEKKSLKILEVEKSRLEITKIRNQEIPSLRDKITSLNKSVQNLVNDVEFLESHIQTLKQSSLEFTKYDNLLMLKESELREAFQSEKMMEIELAELKKEVEFTNKEISNLERKILENENLKKKLLSTSELETWLTSDFLTLINYIEKNILLTLRNEFSKLFNKWFSLLTTDSFYVHLDETFSPVIVQGDYELDYSNLSGGERTAVALAYRLALNQILNSLMSKIKTQGLVILDEPTDGFSDQQLDKIRDILHELKIEQLVIVSHEPKIEGFVENVLRLKKEAGISRIWQ